MKFTTLGYPLALKGYSDSNWISDEDETKATNGYMFTLVGAVISWRSCKQTVLTKPTTEAKLVALEITITEVDSLRKLLSRYESH
jgi:hypothetical protein